MKVTRVAYSRDLNAGKLAALTVLAERLEFTEVPHAVYRLYGAEDVLLYIGFTWNIPARMERHAADKSWWLEVARRTMVWYGSEGEARIAEAIAISTESPMRNQVRPDIGSLLPPEGRPQGYHKRPVLSVRVDPGLKAFAVADAKRSGMTLGDVMGEALADLRAKWTVDAVPVAAEDEQPRAGGKTCKHPNMKLSKGVCPDCFQSVGYQ